MPVTLSLEGKVALITGGTTGIGLAAAKAFVASGARVVVAARNPERGAQAERELRALDGDATFHRCDVSEPSSVAFGWPRHCESGRGDGIFV